MRPLLGAAAAAAAGQQPRAALHASAATRLAAASHSYADPLFDDVPDRRWVYRLICTYLLE